MLGDFITRCLVLAFGYAYPAFECFKTVEKNKVEIEQLRFWCQYWIIVAVITVFERIGDIFISWLPMYGEAKLALFIYLWYPKTKGCGFVYETLLRPYVAKHETQIDRSLQELKARAMDLAIHYWQNSTKTGATKIFELLHFLASHSAHVIRPSSSSEKPETQHRSGGTPRAPPAPSPPSPPSTPSTPSTPSAIFKKHKAPRSPFPPASPTNRRSVFPSPRAETVRTQLEFIAEETAIVDEDGGSSPRVDSEQNGPDEINSARLRLRRSNASRIPLSGAPDPNSPHQPSKGPSKGPKDVVIEDAAEEAASGRVRRLGHGMEVGAGSLLDETVADGDVGARRLGLVGRNGPGRVDHCGYW